MMASHLCFSIPTGLGLGVYSIESSNVLSTKHLHESLPCSPKVLPVTVNHGSFLSGWCPVGILCLLILSFLYLLHIPSVLHPENFCFPVRYSSKVVSSFPRHPSPIRDSLPSVHVVIYLYVM